MKLITSAQGRAMQTYLQDEARPERELYLPQVVDLAMKRYGFLRHSNLNEVAEKGLKFEAGQLKQDGEALTILNLDLYNDGIVAIGRDTEVAEIVLNDAIEWGMATFGIRPPKTLPQRTFASWLVVDFDIAIVGIFEKFSRMHELFAESYESAYGEKLKFDLLRVAFNSDPKRLAPFTNTEFTIDRRGNTSYDLERFFCSAPLRTSDHIALLEKLEAIFKP